MKGWHSWNSDGVNFATAAGETADESLFLTLNGRQQLPRRQLKLRLVVDERGILPVGDFAHTGLQVPRVLSQRAWATLADVLEATGTTASARIAGVEAPYIVWWPSVVADCLDANRSEVYESFSGFRRLVRPAFRQDAVPAVPFVLKGFESQEVWVDDETRRRIESSELLGAEFRHTVSAN